MRSINAQIPGWDKYEGFMRNYCVVSDNEASGVNIFTARKESEGPSIGYVIIRPNGTKQEGAAYIPYIATAEKTHGVRTALLSAAVKRAAELGYRSITLDCRPSVTGFYNKFGEKHTQELQTDSEVIWKYVDGQEKTVFTYTFRPQENQGKSEPEASAAAATSESACS